MCVLDGPFVLANAVTLNLAPSALMKLLLWKRYMELPDDTPTPTLVLGTLSSGHH